MRISLITGIRIGFNPEQYRVNENDGTVAITVEVLDGQIQNQVVVVASTVPGSAIGERGSLEISVENDRHRPDNMFLTFVFSY